MSPLSALLPAIAGIMVVEFLVVAFQPAARRRRFLPTMAAGFFIVLAWNASARGWGLPIILLALTGALVAHAADLYQRW